jgi:hypothetical protein
VTDARADAILRRQDAYKGARGVWNTHWQEIADRVLPRMGAFTARLVPGYKHTERVFDATACLALDRYAAAVESLICPRSEIWHSLAPATEELVDDDECKRYCEALTKLLFRFRYMPDANFGSQAHECFLQLGAFGTTAMLVDDAASHASMSRSSAPILYRAQPLTATWIDENASGRIDTVFREYELDGRQAFNEFGDTTPDLIKKAAEKGTAQKFNFVHAAYPVSDVGPWAWDAPAGASFHSCIVSREARVVVREGFYVTNPFAVSRNVVSVGEVYGRSPAMIVLPDIKTLNEATKTYLRSIHKAVDPPLLLADDGLGGAIDLTPNGLNYGHVDTNGRPLIVPLHAGGEPQLANELRQDLRRSINDAFLVTLFQILVENKEMTAYEAALRAQEKGQLLAPTMGRQETEFLAPMIERELDVLWRRGILQRELPAMPQSLAQAGGVLKVVYTSPLTRLAMAAQVTAIQAWFSDLAPMAQVKPDVLDVVDTDAAALILADARGVPQKARRTPDAVTQARQARAQQVNQQNILAAAPIAAKAAKDAAQAHAISTQAPAPPGVPLPA